MGCHARNRLGSRRGNVWRGPGLIEQRRRRRRRWDSRAPGSARVRASRCRRNERVDEYPVLQEPRGSGDGRARTGIDMRRLAVRSRPAARALPRCTRAPGCGCGRRGAHAAVQPRDGDTACADRRGVRQRRIARLAASARRINAAHECRRACAAATASVPSRQSQASIPGVITVWRGEEALDGGACDGLGRQPGSSPSPCAARSGCMLCAKKPGVDGPRHQHRHRHARASHLPCHRPAQGDEIGLGGAVEREIRHRQHAGEGGDVENAAAAARHHAGQAGVHEGGRRIDIEAESSADLPRRRCP